MAMDEEEEMWRTPSWLYPCILAASAVVLYYRSRMLSQDKMMTFCNSFLPVSFLSFQRVFLGIFFLASVAEGLQFVYGEALYQSNGLKRENMASLLAVGYLSSLFVGTFLGIATDCIGRKKACIFYGLLQLVSSLAKQSTRYRVLLFGSVSQGLATSLYSCTFETWMAAEHEKLAFRHEWLSDTFWIMSFGVAVVAIGSGALVNLLVKSLSLGLAAPSVASAFVSVLLVFGVAFLWEENLSTSQTKPCVNIIGILQSLGGRKILLLGWTQACLDFAVSVFWFLWSPTLVADGRLVHFGLIYPCLMASIMLGSAVAATLLCGPLSERPENFLRFVFGVAAFSLGVPAYDYQEIGILVASFCAFHICSGIAWPSLARLRSIYIPNDHRAGVISLFRMPFNAAIVFVLMKGGLYHAIDNSTIFTLSIIGLLSGIYCLHLLNQWQVQLQEKPPTERP
eukprot:c25631_g1_i2 orf=230-1588(+)